MNIMTVRNEVMTMSMSNELDDMKDGMYIATMRNEVMTR